MSIRKSLDNLITKLGGQCPEGTQIDSAIDALCGCQFGGSGASGGGSEIMVFEVIFEPNDGGVLSSSIPLDEVYEHAMNGGLVKARVGIGNGNWAYLELTMVSKVINAIAFESISIGDSYHMWTYALNINNGQDGVNAWVTTAEVIIPELEN